MLRYVINSDLFKEIFKSGKRGVTIITPTTLHLTKTPTTTTHHHPHHTSPPPPQWNNIHHHCITTTIIVSLRRQTSSPRNKQQHKHKSRGRRNPTTKHGQRRRFEAEPQPRS